MTWTLWIVYFGLARPPTEFNVYAERRLCDYIAQDIVAPAIQARIPEAVILCLPTQERT